MFSFQGVIWWIDITITRKPGTQNGPRQMIVTPASHAVVRYLQACFITSKELPEIIKKTFLSFQLKYFTTVNYRESKMVVLSEFQEGRPRSICWPYKAKQGCYKASIFFLFHLSPQNSTVNCNKTVCPALTCRNPQPKPGECCYSCPGIFILTLQFSELINRSLFFSILIHHRWIDDNKTQTYRENCADLTKRAFPLSVIKIKSKVSWQSIRGKKYTTRSQTELNVKAKKLIGARDQGVIGFSFESNFLRRWPEFFGLILK